MDRCLITPESELVLRAGSPEDRDFICQLTHASLRHLGPFTKAIGDWMEQPSVGTFVAEIENRPVGFFMLALAVSQNGKSLAATLAAIAVEGKFRRLGFGRVMLKLAKQTVAAVPMQVEQRWLELTVAAENTAALGLFTAEGFTRVGPGEDYPSGQRSQRMRCQVKGAPNASI